jgi:hypothetical protein
MDSYFKYLRENINFFLEMCMSKEIREGVQAEIKRVDSLDGWKEMINSRLCELGYRLVEPSDITDRANMGMVLWDARGGVEAFNFGEVVAIELDQHAAANGTVYFHCKSPRWEKQCRTLRSLMLGGPDVSIPLCTLFIVSINK